MDPSAELAIPAPLSPPPRRRFIAFHKWDRNFFLAFLALCWLGVLMGFYPAVTKRLHGHADYPAPLILQIHAFAFCTWLVLLTIQIGLVRVRRPQLHMKLGLVAFALIPVMALSGFFSEIYSQRFRSADPTERPFFIIVIFYVVAFTALASAAVIARKNPTAHKRLILLATGPLTSDALSSLLAAARADEASSLASQKTAAAGSPQPHAGISGEDSPDPLPPMTANPAPGSA